MTPSIEKFSVPSETLVFGCSLLPFASALQLARAGVDELRARFPDTTPSNVKAVYMSGWKSHLQTDKFGPLIEVVAAKIKEAYRAHLNTDLEALNYELGVADCWCAIYEASDHTLPHTHVPSDFAAVVYLEMDEHAAPIVFNGAVAVSPKSGSLVFFPGSLVHHVPRTEGRRVIVAINFFKLPRFLAGAAR